MNTENAHKHSTPRIYLATLAISLTVMLGYVGGMNFIIDPYDYSWPLGSKKVQWFKDRGPRRNTAELLEAGRFDAMMLGSSRVRFVFPTRHPVWGDKVVFNAGHAGTTAYEVEKTLEFAIETQPDLKQVLYMIDFFTYNNFRANQEALFQDFPLSKLDPNYTTKQFTEAYLANLFGYDSLQKSREAYYRMVWGPELGVDETGFSFGHPKDFYRKAVELNLEFYTYYRHFYGGWETPVESLEHFRNMVRMCRENDIELLVAITPIHATQQEAIRQNNLWTEFENWKRNILDIVQESNGQYSTEYQIPFFDFTGYSKFTTEEIPRDPLSRHIIDYYRDTNHGTILLGRFTLSRIFGHVDPDPRFDTSWGAKIETDSDLENYLAQIRYEASVYHQIDPWETDFVGDAVEEQIIKKWTGTVNSVPAGEAVFLAREGLQPLPLPE